MKLKIKLNQNSSWTMHNMYIYIDVVINSLTSKISLVFLLTICCTILMSIWRIGIGLTNNPLTDILLYSHLFYA